MESVSDRVRLDLLYTYFLHPVIGPYLRFQALAAIFPTKTEASEETTVRRVFADGSTTDELVAAGETYSTGGRLPSLELREGVGFNIRLLQGSFATFAFRIGAGFRQIELNDVFVQDDDPETGELELREVAGFHQSGLEAVLVGNIRILRYVTLTTEVEAFGDFKDPGNPALDWQSILRLGLTSFASLDYTVRLLHEPQLVEGIQLAQDVLLRLSWEIL